MTWSKPCVRIYLARHGQSLLNRQQRLSGQAHTLLSDKGRQQAEALCDVLKEAPLTAIYASSLTRAVQTASPTAAWHGMPIQAMDELREINLGVLEGRHFDERDPEAKQLWDQRQNDFANVNIPGAESYPAFSQRVLMGLNAILDKSLGAVLIVGHRNTNELLLRHLLKEGQLEGPAVNVKNKYLYIIDYDHDPAISTVRLGGEKHGQHYQGLCTC
jgi:broad specificity phosphatase PhoE